MHHMHRVIQQQQIAHRIEREPPYSHPLCSMEILGVMSAHIQPPRIIRQIAQHVLQLAPTPQRTIVVALLPQGLEREGMSRQVRR